MFSPERYVRFFEIATTYKPYQWQVEVAEKIHRLEEQGNGLLSVYAETGSGKTEAIGIPALFLGRQLIVVEPYRALLEDMIDRFRKVLARLSSSLGLPYSLGIDYGGEHLIYECARGSCTSTPRPTRKPFGTDVLLTTMDEMVYRLLSVGPERKASIYAALVRLGSPIVFFDEAHAYSVEPANPLVTFIHEAVSLAIHVPVVVASATLPDNLRNHLAQLCTRNGVLTDEFKAPPRKKRHPKAIVTIDLGLGGGENPEEKKVGIIVDHVLRYVKKEHRHILVRVVRPSTAYKVYSLLTTKLRGKYSVGVLHGRMPVKDRKKVLDALKEDMESKIPVAFTSTPAIEAGVNLDFDVAIVELTPYRSLEQTLGRVNRHYEKPDAEVTIVGTDDNTWAILAPKEYLEKTRDILKKFVGKTVYWETIKDMLSELDKKFTAETLSPARLIDMYRSPYSRLLAISFYSLLHLEGTLAEYLVALSKEEYETRNSLDIVVEVEGEPGNYLRVSRRTVNELAKKGIKLYDGAKIPPSYLEPHNYIRRDGSEVPARGLAR